MKRSGSVVFVASWMDACALWRMYFPRYRFDNASFFCFAQSPKYDLVADHDIVVVQRCYARPQLEFIKVARNMGQKVIYDLDDNVWEIPSYNPAATILNQHREGFNACIRMVDAITVSTQPLANAIRKHVKFLVNQDTGKEIPIFVAPNYIDDRFFSEPYVADPLIVGWGGSSSHVGDLPIVAKAIEANAKEFPNVTFEFRGVRAPVQLQNLPNVQFKHWTPVAEYMCRMPRFGWGISLAPVTDCPFNASKSAIKAIEAGYCGIPCLCSWVQCYEYIYTHFDPELKYLLCAGQESWVRKLRELINEPARRLYYGQRLQNVVRDHFTYGSTDNVGWQQVMTFLEK